MDTNFQIIFCDEAHTIYVSDDSSDGQDRLNNSAFTINASAQSISVVSTFCVESVDVPSGLTYSIANLVITINVPKNPNESDRQFTATVHFCDGKTAIIEITQTRIYYRWVTAQGEYICDVCESVSPVPPTPPTPPTPSDYSGQYLTFVALEDGTFKFSGSTTANTLSYSLDDGNNWTALANNTNTPTVRSGNTIMWKASGLYVNDWHSLNNGIGTFSSTGRFNVQGNVMSLVSGDSFANGSIINNSQFSKLFSGCSNMISAENLVLPTSILTTSCYSYMFSGCIRLTSAPLLLATMMAASACTYMFYACRNLTTAPTLFPTTLSDYCYEFMFEECTSLSAITCLAIDISARNCTWRWVDGVAASGTFTKAASMTSWGSGNSGIPENWSIADY